MWKSCYLLRLLVQMTSGTFFLCILSPEIIGVIVCCYLCTICWRMLASSSDGV